MNFLICLYMSRTDGLERSKLNRQGPKEISFKLEAHRPLV